MREVTFPIALYWYQTDNWRNVASIDERKVACTIWNLESIMYQSQYAVWYSNSIVSRKGTVGVIYTAN